MRYLNAFSMYTKSQMPCLVEPHLVDRLYIEGGGCSQTKFHELYKSVVLIDGDLAVIVFVHLLEYFRNFLF